jgi:hypothetical protein
MHLDIKKALFHVQSSHIMLKTIAYDGSASTRVHRLRNPELLKIQALGLGACP